MRVPVEPKPPAPMGDQGEIVEAQVVRRVEQEGGDVVNPLHVDQEFGAVLGAVEADGGWGARSHR